MTRGLKILLTNDDSHRSPLLSATISFFREHQITVVVPSEEQSWKGKSMTRYGVIREGLLDLNGCRSYKMGGTPADCINLGIHNLCLEKPDLVVSGINAGENAGTAFVLSSGTVGACLEANIALTPAIAISQVFDDECMNKYRVQHTLPQDLVQTLTGQAHAVMKVFFEGFLQNGEFLKWPLTWNLNLPVRLAHDFRIRLCGLNRCRYGSCFTKTDLGFEHSLRDVYEENAPESDWAHLQRGDATLTPIDIFAFGQIGREPLNRWKKLFAHDQIS